MKIRYIVTSLLAIAFSASAFVVAEQAQATLLAYESFSYPTGQVVGNGPADLGFAGTWSGATAYSVQPGSLSFPAGTNFVPQGNSARINGTGGTIMHTLATPIDFNTSGTYYVSFLVQKHSDVASSSEFLWLSLNNTSDATYKAAFGLGSTQRMLLGSTNVNAGFSMSPSDNFYSIGETYLYLAKLVTTGSGNDEFFARMYSLSSDTIPDTEPLTWDLTHSNNVSGTAGRLEIFTGANSNYTIDEFRIGLTFDAVAQGPLPVVPPIPEPGSLALLASGIGGVLALGRRRRSRA